MVCESETKQSKFLAVNNSFSDRLVNVLMVMFGSQLWEMNNSFIFENTNDTSLWVMNSIDDMNQLENNKHFFFFNWSLGTEKKQKNHEGLHQVFC